MRDCAFVESIGALVGNETKRFGDVGIREDLSDVGDFALGQEDALAFGIVSERLGGFGPVILNNFSDREAVIGIEDGGLEKIAPGEASELFVKRVGSPGTELEFAL